MTRINRKTASVAVGGGVVASVLTFGLTHDLAQGAIGNASPNSNAAPPSKALGVKATDSAPVGPGNPGTVTVLVTNPNNQPVVLTGLTGQVASVNSNGSFAGTCLKEWITVQPWTVTPTTVPARSSVPITLATTFDNLTSTNQDACRGVTFTYNATATGRQG